MRISLISETYAPQVNGVSRTLGQLVRCLTGAGDSVQVVHPDYGQAVDDAEHVGSGRSPLPWYPDVRLPIPPFAPVCRAIDRFEPDLIHIATEASLGLTALRHARRRGIPVVTSFHTNWDHYSDHYRVGFARALIWRYLRWFHARAIETYVPSRPTIADLEARGFADLVLWPRGVDGRLFSPDRPGRRSVREGARVRRRDRRDRPREPPGPREERRLPGRRPDPRRPGPAGCPFPLRGGRALSR